MSNEASARARREADSGPERRFRGWKDFVAHVVGQVVDAEAQRGEAVELGQDFGVEGAVDEEERRTKDRAGVDVGVGVGWGAMGEEGVDAEAEFEGEGEEGEGFGWVCK